MVKTETMARREARVNLALDGVNGTGGQPGVQGEAGANGSDGLNGSDGALGPQGPAGANGVNGNDGADGTNGTDGTDAVLPPITSRTAIGIPTIVTASAKGTARAVCPSNGYVTGGGVKGTANTRTSYPDTEHSWTASVTGSTVVTAYAVCVQPFTFGGF